MTLPTSSSSTTSGNMPSFFSSGADSRSRSVPDSTHNTTTSGPYVRRGSATLDALTRGLRKKASIDVVLDGKDEFVRTYSTFDKITGHVTLNFDKDTLIGDMLIAFEGTSQTYVEKMATASPTTGRTTGKHTFLRVLQPISSETLPENNLAKANTTYNIPFTFVVPDKLLPYVCSHKVDHDEVKQAHLQLPPSFGDPLLSGEGNVLMDDLAPDMSKIIYSVRAKVGKISPSTGRLSDIEEKAARIRIAPTRPEEPPMSIEDNGSFVMRSEKNVRKGVFKIGKKLGRLSAEVAQPKSLLLLAPNSQKKSTVTTMAAVTLRFDPATEHEQPPQMANLSAKLRVYSFFGAAAYKMIPETSRCDVWSTLHGMYPESVNLSCRNIGSVSWTKHDPENRKKSIASGSSAGDGGALSRRESTFSTSTTSSSSSDGVPVASSSYDSSLPFFTAKVLVPVSLPQVPEAEDEQSTTSSKSPLSRGNKKILFVPTFHTCIISRSYALELGLSFHPVNSQGNTTNALGSSSMTLRTPIQISQDGASQAPIEDAGTYLDLSLVEGTDEYDEAMARHLDQELNFTNPFASGRADIPEAIPEYEEVQTTYPLGAPRHASIAEPPSTRTTQEQPPEYYSPFRNVPAGPTGLGRRVSIRLRS